VEPGRFTDADLGFASSVANVLAEAITRRQADEQLRRNRRELQTVLDHAGVVLFALDAEGRFRMAEGQTLARMGVRREDMIGQPLTSLLPNDPRTHLAVREVLRGRLATYVHMVGGRDLDVVLHPVLGADATDGTVSTEVTGAIGVAIDVTERRLAEVAQQESEAKSRFLAAMSHELRTPLNAVLGFAQLMGMDSAANLSDRQRRYLDNIEQSGRHLLSLINDVLDLSRVAAGQMPIHLEAVDAAEAIESVISQAAPLIDEKQLSIAVQLKGDLVVHADQRRFEQVVWNLLSNAIKFTDPGGRIVVGAAAVSVAGEDWVDLWVGDTGIGIAAGQLESIFDEFTQVESSLTRNHQGTGLGLALSKRLVELMGGSIAVTSEIGRGSRFTVRLAAEPRSAEPAGAVVGRPANRVPTANPPRLPAKGAGRAP
jgi:signal transduction histidine kinase